MGLEIDTGYIVPLGAVKIAEIICLLIGWSTVADQVRPIEIKYRSKNVNFFLAICILAWLFVIVWFICNLLKLFSKLAIPMKHIVFAVIHFVFAILVLIAASLLANDTTKSVTICAFNQCTTYEFGNDTIKAGAAFGIISALILFADGVFHIVFGNKKTGEVANPTA